MSRRGFTLLEMMVAVVIFLLFISAVYGMYTAAHSSMTRAEEQEEVYQTGRVLLAQISAELASAYQPADADQSELTGEETVEGGDGVQRDRLTWLTTAHAASGEGPAGDLCRVTYVLAEEDGDEPAGLYVEEDWTPGLALDDAEPVRRLLSQRVVSFNCEYLPAEGEWETAWTDKTTLPMAVKVSLALQPSREGAPPLVLTATVNLAMATAPASGGGANAQP